MDLKLKREQWRLEGKCTWCGKNSVDERNRRTGRRKSMCRSCLDKNSEKMARLRDSRHVSGLCERCGKEPPKYQRRSCQKCTEYLRKKSLDYSRKTFFNRRAKSADFIYSVSQAQMLWSLWKEQRGICALSGRRLNRENSEIDHIIPKSKGGSNERSNLRWLHKDVNQAKRALNDAEFLALCKEIIDHAGRLS